MLYLKRILIVGLSFVVGLINIIGNNYTVFALEKNTLVHQNVMSMIQSQRGGLFDPIYTESLEDNWQGDYILLWRRYGWFSIEMATPRFR